MQLSKYPGMQNFLKNCALIRNIQFAFKISCSHKCNIAFYITDQLHTQFFKIFLYIVKNYQRIVLYIPGI